MLQLMANEGIRSRLLAKFGRSIRNKKVCSMLVLAAGAAVQLQLSFQNTRIGLQLPVCHEAVVLGGA